MHWMFIFVVQLKLVSNLKTVQLSLFKNLALNLLKISYFHPVPGHLISLRRIRLFPRAFQDDLPVIFTLPDTTIEWNRS